MSIRTFVASTSFAAIVLAVGCATTTEQYLGAEDGGSPPTFIAEGGSDTPDSTFALTAYCPSSECPANRTTCPSSRFLCDIDFQSDPNNCGSCGFVCPKDALGASFACVAGKCEMTCAVADPRLDCNGIVDDGCEVKPTTNDNCGGCGVKCTDPEKPCVMTSTGAYACGCSGSDIACDANGFIYCLDPRKDNENCGACGLACDPTNGGAPTYPNTYYGCMDRQCGRLKCSEGWGDCNGRQDDGCETDLTGDDNCNVCGNVCPTGQSCHRGITGEYSCMCPPEQTYCSFFDIVGFCVDIATDPGHCGSCGVTCAGDDSEKFVYPVCRYGSCETACQMGHADCNGDLGDGCEINTDFDPRNCGECGHACDAVAGQACVTGRCVVEPCDVDAGAAR